MLTKDSRKVLDFMNNNHPNLQDAFFEVDYLSEEFAFDYMRMFGICQTLVDERYLAFGDKQKSAVYVLEKGKNYKDLKTQELIKFLNRSVIIPFFVSLATSAATMYIASFFN